MGVDPVVVSLWPRLLVGGLLLAFAAWAFRRRSFSGGVWLLAIPVVLIVRDLLATVVRYESVYILSDLLIAAAYLLWLNAYLRRPLLPLILAAVGTPLVVLRIATGGADAPLLVHLLTDALLPAGAYGLLLIALLDIRELYVPDAGPVVRSRTDILVLLAPTYLLPMVQGYDHPFILAGVMPLTYIAHFRVFVAYHHEADLTMREAVHFRDQNINTLFEFMARVRHAILQHRPEDTVLQHAVQTLVGTTGADAGAILVLDEDGATLRARAVEGFYPPPYPVSEIAKKKTGAVEKYFKGRPIDIRETVLGEVVRRREGVFIPEPARDQRLARVIKDPVCYVSSFLAVPILLEGRLYGVASVVRRQNDHPFNRTDFDHAMVLGEYASVTLANLLNYIEVLEKQQLESELRMAADIQGHMLPSVLPRRAGVDLSAYSRPARNVGGDYYDIVSLDGGLGVLICDVAGKGVPAALIMVMIRTIFRLSQADTADPGEVTTRINRGVAGSVDIGRFATLTYVSVSPDARTLSYTNAGHLPGLLVSCESGQPRRLGAAEIPVGIESDTTYQTEVVTVEAGDTLVLYTDGLVEARSPSGEEFGEARIHRIVAQHRTKSAETILESVKVEVDAFVQNEAQHDDMTMVVLKLGGGCAD